MSDAELYLHHRREAKAAHARNDGALCVGHSATAHAALVRYATAHGLNTDDAVARIRRASR